MNRMAQFFPPPLVALPPTPSKTMGCLLGVEFLPLDSPCLTYYHQLGQLHSHLLKAFFPFHEHIQCTVNRTWCRTMYITPLSCLLSEFIPLPLPKNTTLDWLKTAFMLSTATHQGRPKTYILSCMSHSQTDYPVPQFLCQTPCLTAVRNHVK